MTETERVLFFLAAFNWYRARYSETLEDLNKEKFEAYYTPELIVARTEQRSGFYLKDEDRKYMIDKLKEEIADKG